MARVTNTARVGTPRLLRRFLGHVWAHGPAGCCWLKHDNHKDRYRSGIMRINGKRYRLARASWLLFIGNPPKHIGRTCGDDRCARPTHLYAIGDGIERAIPKRRTRRKRRHPLYNVRGERHGRAKLSEAMVDSIRNSVIAGAGQAQVARIFGVSQPLVSRIASGLRWGGAVPPLDLRAQDAV